MPGKSHTFQILHISDLHVASELAWGSFAWFVSEPDKIVILSQGGEKKVKHLHIESEPLVW